MNLRLSAAFFLALLASAPPAHASFRDVSAKHVYADSINELFVRRLIRGYPDGNFYPDVRINRVEFVKIVIGALYSEEEIYSCLEDVTPDDIANETGADFARQLEKFVSFDSLKFADVDYGDWYGDHLCMAQIHNIVGGYDDNSFRPLQRVNFAEAATILARAFEVLKAERHLKPDPIWYRPFVEDLSDLRAIPVSIGGFDYYITRGEMAEMVRRLLDYKEKKLKTSLPHLRYEEITRAGNWEAYENTELGFTMLLSDEWPEPYLIKRGFFDGGIPATMSQWRLFFGPADDCPGYGDCLNRAFTLDGFPAKDAEDAIDALQENEDVTILDDKVENGSRMVLFEYKTTCTQRTALFFGEETLYRLNARCGGDIPTQARLLQRVLEQFTVLK